MPEVNWKKSSLLSLIMLATVFAQFGNDIMTLFSAIPILATLNICFMKWNIGSVTERAKSILVRSALFSSLLGLLVVLWIWTTSPGQLGYGDYLQISGSNITPYGYWTISLAALKLGLAALIGGIAVALLLTRRRQKP
jgi:ABC-type sugar transport system permease subunit